MNPAVIHDINKKGTRGVESNPGNLKMLSERLSPAEKEIGDDGIGRGSVGVEPLNNGVMELTESQQDGDIAMVADIFDVFNAMGQFGMMG